MLERGEWRPTVPGDSRTAGFHLSSLYSPVGWFSWADAAEMYEQAQKTPDLMKGFVNTVLGLPFEEEAEALEWQRLYERREVYRIGVVPEPGLFLTAGVDVQKDRIEVEVVAWGRGKESWSVDYRVIEGDTARPDVWAKLDAVLDRDWPHASGHTLPLRVMCVDAGYATQDVYAWVRQHPQASWGPACAAARQPRTAVAVKGRDQDTALLLSVFRPAQVFELQGLVLTAMRTRHEVPSLVARLVLPLDSRKALGLRRRDQQDLAPLEGRRTPLCQQDRIALALDIAGIAVDLVEEQVAGRHRPKPDRAVGAGENQHAARGTPWRGRCCRCRSCREVGGNWAARLRGHGG